METEEKIENLAWQLIEMVAFQVLSLNSENQQIVCERDHLVKKNDKLRFMVDGYGHEPEEKMTLAVKEQK